MEIRWAMNTDKKKFLANRRDFLKRITSLAFSFKPLSIFAANNTNAKNSIQRWMLASHRIHPMTKLIPFRNETYCKSTSAIFTTTPDYSISKLKLSFSNWVTLSTGVQKPEVDGPAPIKVKGAIFVDGTIFAKLTFKGKDKVSINPGGDVWCDEVKVPQWIGRNIEIRTYCETKLGVPRPVSYRNRESSARDAVIYDTNDARHLALLNGQEEVLIKKYRPYFYGPSLMVSNGWDGRHVILCVGDSIGYGNNFGSSWLTNAIDDKQGLRLPYANFCVQGTRASGQSSLKEGAYRRKTALLSSVNANPAFPPFTCVLSQMGVNDAWGNDGKKLLNKMQKWWAFIKEQWPSTILVQTTYTPKCAKDKVNYYTNYPSQQSVTTTPPDADRWYVADIIKTVPSPLDSFIDVREAWTGNKTGHLWRQLNYTGRLTKGLAKADTTCVVDNAPPMGGAIVFSAGTSEKKAELPYAVITKIEGTGPYKVTFSNPVTKRHPIGSSVKVTMSRDGTHPFGRYANQFALQEVLNFKVKKLSKIKHHQY
ncbi:MAG: hypothetical protein ACKE5M_04815 [Methylophilaceae bacterium]